MGSRGHGPPYGGRSTQPSSMMRHGSYSLSHSIEPHHDHRDNQPSEMERLAADNKRLATTHVALRQDLAATQQEIQKLRAHIGSIHTESDIQVRILMDKIAKMEGHIRAGENVKNDLQRAHTEARALVASRQELIGQIEQTTKEFEKVHADVDKLPEMQSQLDGLRLEHHKLWSSFEQEKKKNTEKVAQMEVTEKELFRMSREVERLRSEVVNADKMPHGPNVYGGPYMNPEQYPPPPPQPPPPPHMHMHHASFVDGYGNHHHGVPGEGMIPYGGVHHLGPGGHPPWGPPGPFGGPHPPPGVNPHWVRPPF